MGRWVVGVLACAGRGVGLTCLEGVGPARLEALTARGGEAFAAQPRDLIEFQRR